MLRDVAIMRAIIRSIPLDAYCRNQAYLRRECCELAAIGRKHDALRLLSDAGKLDTSQAGRSCLQNVSLSSQRFYARSVSVSSIKRTHFEVNSQGEKA